MLYITIIIGIVMLHAFVDAFIIQILGKKINHTKELLLFLLACIIPSVLMWGNETIIQRAIFCGVTILLARAALFDYLLNLFRHLSVNYISSVVKNKNLTKDQSWFDWIEYQIGFDEKKVRMFFLIMLIVWIIYNK